MSIARKRRKNNLKAQARALQKPDVEIVHEQPRQSYNSTFSHIAEIIIGKNWRRDVGIALAVTSAIAIAAPYFLPGTSYRSIAGDITETFQRDVPEEPSFNEFLEALERINSMDPNRECYITAAPEPEVIMTNYEPPLRDHIRSTLHEIVNH
ncbi:MAG: hypothetical protein ABIG93_02130 [archaeon]|nr:hypothetical protein [Nanoarchaeota archaeon]